MEVETPEKRIQGGALNAKYLLCQTHLNFYG